MRSPPGHDIFVQENASKLKKKRLQNHAKLFNSFCWSPRSSISKAVKYYYNRLVCVRRSKVDNPGNWFKTQVEKSLDFFVVKECPVKDRRLISLKTPLINSSGL